MARSAYINGRRGEQYAINYLKRDNFQIVAHNWKTRSCEIDIIAERDGCKYFIEVKTRSSVFQGEGLDYVTPQKLMQMEYAAKLWAHIYKYRGSSRLGIISVNLRKLSLEYCEIN